MQSLVSVIIPAYNGAAYIHETIEGIKRQGVNVEIIVIDDASTDNTAEIAAAQGAKVIRNAQNIRQILSKNVGLKAAQGEFIIFHDQDDIMREGALSRLLSEFENEPQLLVVIAQASDFLSPDADLESGARLILQKEYYGLLSAAVLFRREVFDIIGLFKDEYGLHTGERIMLQDKLDRHGIRQKKINFVSTDRRIHDNNFGRTNQKKEYRDYAAVLRARLKEKI
jgi:glycosyltransferase involved in cell wall biosynthesis